MTLTTDTRQSLKDLKIEYAHLDDAIAILEKLATRRGLTPVDPAKSQTPRRRKKKARPD